MNKYGQSGGIFAVNDFKKPEKEDFIKQYKILHISGKFNFFSKNIIPASQKLRIAGDFLGRLIGLLFTAMVKFYGMQKEKLSVKIKNIFRKLKEHLLQYKSGFYQWMDDLVLQENATIPAETAVVGAFAIPKPKDQCLPRPSFFSAGAAYEKMLLFFQGMIPGQKPVNDPGLPLEIVNAAVIVTSKKSDRHTPYLLALPLRAALFLRSFVRSLIRIKTEDHLIRKIKSTPEFRESDKKYPGLIPVMLQWRRDGWGYR